MSEGRHANTVCPYCSATLDPLPKAKKACPNCRPPIYPRSGPDGLIYLLQAADLPTMEAAWAKYFEKRDGADLQARRADGYRITNESLAEYAAEGTCVQLVTADDPCEACRNLGGRILKMAPAGDSGPGPDRDPDRSPASDGGLLGDTYEGTSVIVAGACRGLGPFRQSNGGRRVAPLAPGDRGSRLPTESASRQRSRTHKASARNG